MSARTSWVVTSLATRRWIWRSPEAGVEVVAGSSNFHDMLLHGQLVVQMKAEIADDSGRLYSRRSYSKWTVQAVQVGQICRRSEPDSLSFVGVQLQVSSIGSRMRCIAWWHFQWPWRTLTRFSRSRHIWSRISQKRCILGTKLLKNINRKPYAIYRMVQLSMTLSDLWPRF